ncbi:Hsp70 family protein [Buchnera aphidicola]|uniref:Fe-S protein assembly chaperone HscA n=1 Tax=Buchnera aphidicola subsp. Melaphis rhois TaxID=118103 RepID=A0A4D6YAV3_BUCMH|nr:Hsp70 family protein [Buchnera aphidicola]QCI23551.1 Fe-S protein assembly chaperone HscA [Buchnera aphidicola (Melaphis rhois)]
MITIKRINKNSQKFITQENDIISFGIDFGTTYSLIATANLTDVAIISDSKNRALLPSIVNYSFSKPIVGWKARNMSVNDPINTITSIKRFIGSSLKEIKKLYPDLPYNFKSNTSDTVEFIINNTVLNTIDISSQIFNTLKNRIITLFGQKINRVVITVPANFNDTQRQEIKKSAQLANLNVLRLLNEPTAAAIAYGLHLKKKGIIAIYDLGGGTFDISILNLHNRVFEVLSTSGSMNLGGDDIDYLLLKYIKNKIIPLHSDDLSLQKELLNLAQSIKIQLSFKHYVTTIFKSHSFCITRMEFNNVIQPIVLKTLNICKHVIHDAKISIENIDHVILVGGSTYIPIIRQRVMEYFKKNPLFSINPDEVVVAGSAIQANMLTKKNKVNNIILLDVISQSLGIEVMGNIVEKIIYKNTKIPISQTREFTTFKDNQKSILIHIVQGEESSVFKCKSLSRFVLKNIPEKPAGKVIVIVKFQIDVDGLLSITAKIKSTKIEQKIFIDSNYT